MFRLITVAVAVFSISCIDTVASSALAEVCKAAGASKITLCSAIGFNGADGNIVYDSVFSQGLGESVVIARDEVEVDVGSSDIAVAMVKTVELNGDLNGLQVAIQNILENSMYSQKATKLIVIVTGREDNESDRSRVLKVAEEVWSLLPKAAGVGSKKLSDYMQITVHGVALKDEQAVSSVAASVRAAVQGFESPSSGSEVASLLNRKASVKAVRAVSSAESRAVGDCASIAEDFLQDLRSRLASSAARLSAPLPASEIAAAVSKSLSDNYSKHALAFSQHGQSDAMRAASYRAHAGLSAILQPYYRRAVGTLKMSLMRGFEVLILRVAPNSRLVAALKSQAAAIYDLFLLKSSELKTEYSQMFLGLTKLDFPTMEMVKDAEEPETDSSGDLGSDAETSAAAEIEVSKEEKGEGEERSEKEEGAEGVEGVEGVEGAEGEVEGKIVAPVKAPVAKAPASGSGSGTGLASIRANILNGPWVGVKGRGADVWGLGTESQGLRNDLAESCAERERFLFLSGAYNPYVRDMPIPPTKLSFNYLLDPKGLSYGRGYDVLYDEQTDGIAEKRANPLQIYGVAEIPFNPNEHPIPRDNTPWWRVIVDFYKGDEEE